MLRLNPDRCKQIGLLLQRIAIPPSEEEFALAGISPKEASNFLLLAVAICHQTQSLRGSVKGKELRGWDFLSTKLLEQVKLGQISLDPATWTDISTSALAETLPNLSHSSAQVALEERLSLIYDMGRTMTTQHWRTLEDCVPHGNPMDGYNGRDLLETLRIFRAYQDPVQKKSLYLISLLGVCANWKLLDRDALPPPVDYHEVRGHLRLGTVEITCDKLLQSVLSGEAVSDSEDIAIRFAVQKAISAIAMFHGATDGQTLHYLFWNVFRNVCTRDKPQCSFITPANQLPHRYQTLLHLHETAASCPFLGMCTANASQIFPLEHNIPNTQWY